MIEQTELVVDEWIYIEPIDMNAIGEIQSEISLEVMKKTAPTKKGLACRFTCQIKNGTDLMLLYVAWDSYVIDEDDAVDVFEIRRMIKNSFSKFTEKYEFRKLGTALQNTPMKAFDEMTLDLSDIVPLLN